MKKNRIPSAFLVLALMGSNVLGVSGSTQEEIDVRAYVASLDMEVPNLSLSLSEPLDEYLENYQETIYFISNFSDFELSYNEIVANRLEAAGVSLHFLDNLSEEQIEIIAKSEKAFVAHSYFKEDYDYENRTLIPISRVDFEGYLERQYNPQDIADYAFERLRVGNYVEIVPSFLFSEGWIEQCLASGTVHVITAMFHLGNGIYVATTEFLWTTMPRHRGTDFFVLGRSNGLGVFHNGDFQGFMRYNEYRRRFTAGLNFVSQRSYGSTTNNIRLFNELGTTNQGAGIRINHRHDAIPPQWMAPGSTFMARVIYGVGGGVSYTGTLSAFSNQPQRRTHYVSYLHQTGTVWFGSPSISVGLAGPSLSVNVSPSANFAHPIQNNLTLTWH